MSQSISPYALLQASKPRPAPTITTAYDLYSAVQSASCVSSPASPPVSLHCSSPDPIRDTPPAPREQGTPAAHMPLVPVKRTHYIADIQTRHDAALRRAVSRPYTPTM